MKSRSAVVPVSPSARFHPSADNHARSNGQSAVQEKVYVLDTNVLIHDPNSVLNFEENRVVIPMTVLEELDHLKNGKASAAADCRAAIRLIDQLLGGASFAEVNAGVPIQRAPGQTQGFLSVLMLRPATAADGLLPEHLNDNRIINDILALRGSDEARRYVLVTKDINMRLKARALGLDAEDYQNDQLVSDIRQLTRGFFEVEGSFWSQAEKVDTRQDGARTLQCVSRAWLEGLVDEQVFVNQFVLDEEGFVGRVIATGDNTVTLLHLNHHGLMQQSAWGLKPINIHQALALHLLLDPDVHLVTLTGSAGSGKTILALAAAIEMTVEQKRFNKIIATRSTPPLAEEHGFLPGTEEEKMDPWLGAINDNIEALHLNDESPKGSIEYVKERANIQFKALNYIRGRSFQRSLILIDESQNLTPHQMKAIITRAGEGSKVVCLGNLAQIDTAYLSATSSGLTYMTECFKGFELSGSVQLQGVPRSRLAEYAEANM